MVTDTYQQRRLEAALLRQGLGPSWREYLAKARRARHSATKVSRELNAYGITVDPRTLLRWTRQAVTELAHQTTGRREVSMAELGFHRDPNQPDP